VSTKEVDKVHIGIIVYSIFEKSGYKRDYRDPAKTLDLIPDATEPICE
jgi:hypothetical protein